MVLSSRAKCWRRPLFPEVGCSRVVSMMGCSSSTTQSSWQKRWCEISPAAFRTYSSCFPFVLRLVVRKVQHSVQDMEASSSTFETSKLVVNHNRMLEITLEMENLCIHHERMLEAFTRREGLCIFHKRKLNSSHGKVCGFTTKRSLKHSREVQACVGTTSGSE